MISPMPDKSHSVDWKTRLLLVLAYAAGVALISQSSVRGLSDARRALATARRELNATGANASVIETAATRARERICMVEVKVKELSLIFMKWRYARCEKR